ncbi:hypothetical protein OSTOST_08548, partial [Ostertagia ostertagi]
MMSLSSLQEEDLDEICIDFPSDVWHNNDSRRHSRTLTGGVREQLHSGIKMGRRSYSQPEIHVVTESFVRPDE